MYITNIKRQKLNKNIIYLGFVSFFTDMASAMVSTILPLYVVYILKDGVDKLGIIVGIATFISYFFRVIFGIISDKYQIVKPFIVTGYIISAISKPLLAFTSNWQEIALLRGIERMGKAIRSATKDKLISFYAENKSGRSFGFHKMMDIGGETIGALVAFLALYFIGKNIEVFKGIFLATIVPGVIAVILVVFFVEDVPFEKKEKQIDLSKDKPLFPFLFVYFAFLFFMFSNEYFVIKAKEVGFDMAFIPLLVILLNFTQTITSYYFGTLIDKYSPKKIITFSYLFGIASMIFVCLDLVILAFIFLGLFLVSSLNSIRSYISINAVNKASVYGIFYGGVAISSSFGAVIIGQIWEKVGERVAEIFSLSGLIVVFIIYLFLSKMSSKKAVDAKA